MIMHCRKWGKRPLYNLFLDVLMSPEVSKATFKRQLPVVVENVDSTAPPAGKGSTTLHTT